VRIGGASLYSNAVSAARNITRILGLVVALQLVSSAPAEVYAAPAEKAATIAVAPSGNDATCTRGKLSRPCATFEKAYAIARCGDVVEVGAGSYGNQNLVATTVGSSCKRNRIVFRPVAGARPTINHISFGQFSGGFRTDAAHNVVLKGFKVTWGVVMWGDVVNVTLDHLDGGSFLIDGGSNITIRNSDWGPCTPSGSFDGHFSGCRHYYLGDPISGQPRLVHVNRLLLEGNTFHDMPIDLPGAHWECLWVAGGTDVTIRGNRFSNCQTSAISMGDQGDDANIAGKWLIEDNWFGPCPGGTVGGDGPYCLNITSLPSAATISVRFNSFAPGEYLGCEGGCGDPQGRLRVSDNIFGSGSVCVPGGAYKANLFIGPGSGCGPTDRGSVFGYTYDGSRLVPNPRPARAVKSAFATVVARKVKSLRLMARSLSRRRMLAPRGGWKATTVRAIVVDDVYVGHRLGIQSRHPGIVSLSEWKQAQRALAAVRK
jgi:Recombinase/Right handed beta helix region